VPISVLKVSFNINTPDQARFLVICYFQDNSVLSNCRAGSLSRKEVIYILNQMKYRVRSRQA
jgi:hypothetical protein